MAIRFTGSTTTGVVVDANSDTWITLQTQYVSSNGDAFDFGAFDNVEYILQGDLYSGSDGISSTTGANFVSVVVGEGASITAASDAIELLGDPSTDLGHTIVNNGAITSLSLEGVDVRAYSSSLVNNGLITAEGFGVYFQGNSNAVTNNGTITAAQVGVGMIGDFADLVNFGTVSSATSNALDAAGDDCRVENHGFAVGNIYGIDVTGDGNYVFNAGEVSGRVGVRIGHIATLPDGSSSELRNDGTITGLDVGVEIIAVGSLDRVRIVNSGEIGVQSADGPAIRGLTGIDEVINSGVIDGRVELGDGSDLYRGLHGLVRGVVDGGGGNDVLAGGGEDDEFDGGGGRDMLRGRDGDDVLTGGGANDTLRGGAGDDVLNGGAKADLIDGGRDDDTLTGGGAADTFFFGPQAGFDVITDFQDGTDLIDVSRFSVQNFAGLSAAITTAGGDAFIDWSVLGGQGVLQIEGAAGVLNGADFIF